MARTRTQTGVITKTRYDYPTLVLIGRRRSEDIKVTKSPSRSAPGRWNSLKDLSIEEAVSPSVTGEVPRSIVGKGEEKNELSHPTNFWPSVILGAEEKRGLTAIERADHRVAQWETILREHEKSLPEAVPHIESQLQLARRQRNVLDNTEENNTTCRERERINVISTRIEVLELALKQSCYEPERENIRGAIEGYKSGRIGYSKRYTLIWAGRLVDEANTYGEITLDRSQRLERYTAAYGPHWLWLKSPLWIHPDGAARASACAILNRTVAQHSLGLYYINQGFNKRRGWVTTIPVDGTYRLHGPNVNDQVNAGKVGPRLVFRSMLDSGATFPSLYRSDLRSLGICPDSYAAQSILSLSTANGITACRAYEMFVEVCDSNGQSMIDPFNPVQPAWPTYIGGLGLVVEVSSSDAPIVNENGFEQNERLSGVMPLFASYVSSTPSQNMLILGEDRNDVLGLHKTPAAKRWVIGLSSEAADLSHWGRLGDPAITFSHRDGAVRDQDIGPGRSQIKFFVGQPDEQTIVVDPRGDYAKLKQQAAQTA
ncbi:MAG: hypothetical protein M1812_006096 [Candelaria pacifica]|nr:MAG: hypothetical protein M1812_006096 [Candelaria pacifica]